MLVDWLREPGLRRRAREQFARRLSGAGARATRRCSRATRSWGSPGRCWPGAFAVVLTLRYEPIMTALAPDWVVHVVMGTLWVAFFVPVVVVVGKPLLERLRGRVGT